jgi:hypothetical protein
MGFGVSLFLIALGAILAWAVTAQVEGIDINAVGVILMIVGAMGLLLSLLFYASLLPWEPHGHHRGSHDMEHEL